jgi:hypothetical protein
MPRSSSLGCRCCPVPSRATNRLRTRLTPVAFSYATIAFYCPHDYQNLPHHDGNHMFVPRPLEPVQVDKITVKLYLVVNLTMKPPERAHAFQMNEAALAMPGIDRRMMLDTPLPS